MASASDTIDKAQGFLGGDLEFKRLDQVHDLQQLMGSVIAYKVLLNIAISSNDENQRRMAASKLLDATTEGPDKIAERLRKSAFSELTLAQLEAVVKTGITDPDKAVARLFELHPDLKPNENQQENGSG